MLALAPGKTGAAASLQGKALSKFPNFSVEGVVKRPPSSNAWPGLSARRRHQQNQIQPQVPSPTGGLVAALLQEHLLPGIKRPSERP